MDQNQYEYLSSLAQGDDGNAEWAKSQLENSDYTPPAPSAPATDDWWNNMSADQYEAQGGNTTGPGGATPAGIVNQWTDQSSTATASPPQDDWWNHMSPAEYEAQGGNTTGPGGPTPAGIVDKWTGGGGGTAAATQPQTQPQQPPTGQPPVPGQPPVAPNQQTAALQKMIDQLNQQLTGSKSQYQQVVDQMNQQVAGNKQYTDALYKQFQDSLDAANNKKNAQWEEEKKLAAEQSQKIFDQKKASYQQIINDLKTGQGNDLSAISGRMDAAKGDIEDKTFQNWLSLRQQAANSGLSGSGIASDADTRLLLAKQKDMAGLMNTNLSSVANVNRDYSDRLGKANQVLGELNQGDIEKGIFQDLYKTGSTNMTDQAKLFADLLGKQMGYSQVNPNDLLKAGVDLTNNGNNNAMDQWKAMLQNNQYYDKLGSDQQAEKDKLGLEYDKLAQQNKQFYNKLDVNQQTELAKIGFDYQKLTTENKQFYDKLNQQGTVEAAKLQMQAKKMQLDAAKIMGVDSEGNPTLDSQKLMEQIRNNQSKETETMRHNQQVEAVAAVNASTSATNAQTRIGELGETITKNQSQIAMQAAQLKNTHWNDQGQMLSKVANENGQKVQMLLKAKTDILNTNALKTEEKQKQLEPIDKQLKIYMKDYDDSTIGLQFLMEGSYTSGSYDQSGSGNLGG